jgi:16S rRNA (adenine1518-N6/adenine1519-N6)-dimethyltransferase
VTGGPSAPAAPRPKKSLGQHFLRSPDICRRIAELLDAGPSDSILEIGPGEGALTRALEAVPHRRLVLLEKDAHWATARQRQGSTATQAVCGDCLAFGWGRLGPDWLIAGNLPYNVASPMIWDMAANARGPRCAVLMVQREVGERLAASPGSRRYGALTVWTQSFARVRLAFTVKPGAFRPPPKVDSAVIVLEWHGERPQDVSGLARAVKGCFAQRRKQLGTILKNAGLPEIAGLLEEMGIPLTLRPEELDVAAFQRIGRSWPLRD